MAFAAGIEVFGRKTEESECCTVEASYTECGLESRMPAVVVPAHCAAADIACIPEEARSLPDPGKACSRYL